MPIHNAAASGHGVQFCKMLVELAPGCERIPCNAAFLPLHGAQRIDTVKYLLGIYPESIYASNQYGMTPFQYAVRFLKGSNRDDILQYFLEIDPSFASVVETIVRDGRSVNLLPLHVECTEWGEDKPWWKHAEVVKILFDYYPNAVLATDADGKLPVDLVKGALADERVGSYHDSERKKTISFLETQYPFVTDASNNDALNTPDENGMLLLHRALIERGISLGTIKTVVNGTNHDAALRGPNPLHFACANCSPDIIQYLFGVYSGLVNSVDDEGCNILHLACKGRHPKSVQYLLDNYAPLVSETNNLHQLPIHILCDKSGKDELLSYKYVDDQQKHREYVGVIWQLLLACPAAVSSAVAHLD